MNGAVWFVVGALALAYVRQRGAAKVKADQWREEVPINGTDFQGAIWDRLNGTDLLSARWEDRNLVGSTNADPGRVGQAQMGLMPDWKGNL